MLASFLANMPHVYDKCYSVMATNRLPSQAFRCRPQVPEEGRAGERTCLTHVGPGGERKDPVSFEIKTQFLG